MIDRETAMKLASDAGFEVYRREAAVCGTIISRRLERICAAAFKMGAATEREACAKLCEAQHEEDRPSDYAYSIRARGTGGAG